MSAAMAKRVSELEAELKLWKADLKLWRTAYLQSVQEQGISLGFEHEVRTSDNVIYPVLELKHDWEGKRGADWRKHTGEPEPGGLEDRFNKLLATFSQHNKPGPPDHWEFR